MKICSICKKEYSEPSALSRKDNQTEICPDCGLREALEAFGVKDDKVQEVMDVITDATKPQVYTMYSAEGDMTFIMEDKGNTTSVVGFYYGTPDDEATKEFYGKTTATFEM